MLKRLDTAHCPVARPEISGEDSRQESTTLPAAVAGRAPDGRATRHRREHDWACSAMLDALGGALERLPDAAVTACAQVCQEWRERIIVEDPELSARRVWAIFCAGCRATEPRISPREAHRQFRDRGRTWRATGRGGSRGSQAARRPADDERTSSIQRLSAALTPVPLAAQQTVLLRLCDLADADDAYPSRAPRFYRALLRAMKRLHPSLAAALALTKAFIGRTYGENAGSVFDSNLLRVVDPAVARASLALAAAMSSSHPIPAARPPATASDRAPPPAYIWETERADAWLAEHFAPQAQTIRLLCDQARSGLRQSLLGRSD